MSLMNCPTCNKEVSTWARVCPHCGGMIITIEKVVLAIIVVLAFGYLFWYS